MRGRVLSLVAVVALVGCGNQNQKATTSLPEDSAGIVNGSEVLAPNRYSKHTVFIQTVGPSGGGLCTGSIYDSQTILTAAHCLVGATQAAIVFATNVRNPNEIKREQVRLVKAAVAYPRANFGPESSPSADEPQGSEAEASPIPKIPTVDEVARTLEDNNVVLDDVALLHFSGGLPEGYEPVQFATSESLAEAGTTLHMIGYGLARVNSSMQIVEGKPVLVAVPDSSTTGQLRETQVAISKYSPKTKLIFTDGTSTSVCSGDSGGPAFVTDPATGQVLQVGIAEAVSTEYCNSVSMHTAIFPYLSWIKEAAATLAEQANQNVAMF